MGYSVSMRHQPVKRDAAGGLIRHSCRSLEGGFQTHANEMIDAGRTGLNEVLVRDGTGGFRAAQTISEVDDAVQARLAQRKNPARKIRENQNVLMETVLQLDPDFTGGMGDYLSSTTHSDRIDELQNHMVNFVVDRVGRENICYIAMHLDETQPHVHIGWVPLADDLSLDYRKVLGEMRADAGGRMRGVYNPDMMRREHQDLRDHMRSVGYEAEYKFSNRPHMSPDVFKRFKDAEHGVRDAAQVQAQTDLMVMRAAQMAIMRDAQADRDEVDEREQAVGVRETMVYAREQDADNREQDLDDREAAVTNREERARQRDRDRVAVTLDIESKKRTIADLDSQVKDLEQQRETMKSDVANLQEQQRQMQIREKQFKELDDEMQRLFKAQHLFYEQGDFTTEQITSLREFLTTFNKVSRGFTFLREKGGQQRQTMSYDEYEQRQREAAHNSDVGRALSTPGSGGIAKQPDQQPDKDDPDKPK